MKLSARLQQVLDYLLPAQTLADIGCDHAFLPLAYVHRYPMTFVYAMDNKQEPLNQAIKNIEEIGAGQFIIPLLSEGLEKMPTDVKQLSIAGMGGNNIVDILSAYPNKLNYIECIVMQPNNNAAGLRHFLVSNGYLIAAETLVNENEIIYEVIKAVKGKQKLSKEEIIFGPYLLQQKDPLFFEKWGDYARYLENIYSKIPAEYASKRESIAKELELIKKVIS